LDPTQVERKLAAILSADVVGYSRLMAEDEAATVRTLTDYREVVATLIRQHRGRVVDSPGDNVLAEFPTALEAARGAVEVQRVIQARNADLPPERRMEFRIGVHLGDVTVEGERLYGDGVNIAARLEGLAAPGGVCLSGTVYEQVERKLNVPLEDLGEQELKNIPRPVRVYGLKLPLSDREAEAPERSLPGMEELTVPGFSGRPAIAVLPFDNLSGDPEQEYFADGLAEDLITRLSSWRGFPVIARNSTFTYKGKAVDVKRVSRELGARYVVEGSVRRAGDRVRVSAQLIDATTGHHVWAERYDRELSDIFALQDEITEAIVASMHPGLRDFEWQRTAHQDPESLDAWDSAQRANWHLNRFEKDENAKARALYERAARLDPHSVAAFFGIANTHYLDALYQWTDSTDRSIAELEHAARTCASIDSKNPLGRVALGLSHRISGQPNKAIAAFELAVELNPNSSLAHGWLGISLAEAGRAEEALERLEKGIRLSPQDSLMSFFLHAIAMAHFGAGRYEEAVDWDLQALNRGSDVFTCYQLASSYGHLGKRDEARGAIAEASRLVGGTPPPPPTSYRIFGAIDPAFAGRAREGWRKAGLME
jgi:TolB-like protein/class 3 adenylate cyclase/Tfp pilus assembly protein PilF